MIFSAKLKVGDRVVVIVESPWYKIGEEYTIDVAGCGDLTVHMVPDNKDDMPWYADPSHLRKIK